MCKEIKKKLMFQIRKVQVLKKVTELQFYFKQTRILNSKMLEICKVQILRLLQF